MKVVCPECDNEFEYESVPEAGMGYVNCPNCSKPVTQNDKSKNMKKIVVDPALKGKDLTAFLIENKDAMIAERKSAIKHTDPCTSIPSVYNVEGAKAIKTAPGEALEAKESVRVKVVANTALWLDSYLDVLTPDCWKNSIKTRKGLIPHLHDHEHKLGAEVGDVVDIYSQDISLTDLGLNKKGKTQCLIFETDIRKAYNEMVFRKYATGKVKQHSIALQYVKIDLAINDEESEKEFTFWKKYYDQLINPEDADETGFFFVVTEIKLLENSAVLFGANALTPTLDVKADTFIQPDEDTTEEKPLPFDLSKAITETKFIN